MIALIVGGSAKALAETERARRLCKENCEPFLINQAIGLYAGAANIAVSLHPLQLPDWLARRQKNGYSALNDIWSTKRNPANRTAREWLAKNGRGGSGALFAVKIALEEYRCTRVILCGVPLTVEGGHIGKDYRFTIAAYWRQAWKERIRELRPRLRSMSGWTRETFGAPDEAFINAG